MKTKTTLAIGFAVVGLATGLQASLLVNSGIDANNNGIDDNWTLVSGTAYVAKPDTTWPFSPSGPWLANDSTSKWLTYSNPLWTGGNGDEYYDYQLTIDGGHTGTFYVRWLSDNDSILKLDGVEIGERGMPPNPSNYTPFNSWNAWQPITLTGTSQTLDILVHNIGQNSSNPTGMRFEVVPEPTTMIAGALLLLPFGVSTLRMLRKNRVA